MRLLWNQNNHYYRHTKTRITAIRDLFPVGIYKNTPTILKKLEEIRICIPQNDRFYPCYCYNFEAYFSQENLPENLFHGNFDWEQKSQSTSKTSEPVALPGI